MKMRTDNRQYEGEADIFLWIMKEEVSRALMVRHCLLRERCRESGCGLKSSVQKQFDEARVIDITRYSENRVEPKCRYFDTCGGCSIQHIDSTAQIAFKQRIMEEQLERIGKIRPKQILPAIYGTPWHYRERARLSISKDAGGRLKIGFKAKRVMK